MKTVLHLSLLLLILSTFTGCASFQRFQTSYKYNLDVTPTGTISQAEAFEMALWAKAARPNLQIIGVRGSGSMTPAFGSSTYLLVDTVPLNSILEGDFVVFAHPKNPDEIVVHQFLKWEIYGERGITKGIANNKVDTSRLTRENFRGKIVGNYMFNPNLPNPENLVALLQRPVAQAWASRGSLPPPTPIIPNPPPELSPKGSSNGSKHHRNAHPTKPSSSSMRIRGV